MNGQTESQGAKCRSGFTLVEMLVVIAIIAILAGLITAAAASALWSAKQTKIKTEVDMLAGAMESFKQKYGAYPPANLYCYQQGGSGPYIANPQLVAFVAKAFPRYAVVTGTSLGNQIYIDLVNAGVDITHFNPQGALVFWLSGFSPDPTDPFNRNNQQVTRTPFFTFDQTRLVYSQNTSSAGAVSLTGTAYGVGAAPATGPQWSAQATPSYGLGQLIYNAPYGNAAYCYFDYQSYGNLNSQNTSNPLPGALAASSGVGIVYAATTGASETLNGLSVPFALYNGTGLVMPYALDVNNNNYFDSSDTFCKPTSFQIISAGQDGAFGTTAYGSVNPGITQGKLYPSGLNTYSPNTTTIGGTGISYDPPPPNGGSADDDNVTNFCERNNLAAAKP